MSSVRKPTPEGAPPATVSVVDPVCGMPFERRHAAATERVGRRTYHFCSLLCAREFQRDPRAYTGRDAQESDP